MEYVIKEKLEKQYFWQFITVNESSFRVHDLFGKAPLQSEGDVLKVGCVEVDINGKLLSPLLSCPSKKMENWRLVAHGFRYVLRSKGDEAAGLCFLPTTENGG